VFLLGHHVVFKYALDEEKRGKARPSRRSYKKFRYLKPLAFPNIQASYYPDRVLLPVTK
jgi:hypothetical protein